MTAAGLMRSVISAQTHIVSVCMQPLSTLPFLPIIFLPPGLSLRYDVRHSCLFYSKEDEVVWPVGQLTV